MITERNSCVYISEAEPKQLFQYPLITLTLEGF